MKSRLILALACGLAFWPSGIDAAGRKTPSNLFTLHVQGTPDQGEKFVTPVKLGSEAQQYYFSIAPEIHDNHVAAIYPFISRDGATYGVSFILNQVGRERLSSVTLQNQGRLVGIHLLGGHNSALFVDRPVDDGVVVVWEGLTQAQIKTLSKKFQVLEANNAGQ